MNMIRHTTRSEKYAPFFSNDSTEVGIEPFFPGRVDERSAFLGGVDNMVIKFGVSGGHVLYLDKKCVVRGSHCSPRMGAASQ